YYKIYAYKSKQSSWNSSASSIVAAYTKTTKPLVSKSYTSGKVKLTWKKVTRATAYHIYKLNSSGKYTKLATTTSLSYYDTDVTKNKRYTYKVVASYKADNKTIVGFYSSAVSIYTAKIDPNKKMVALTFDDGPGPYTQEIVNCLAKYDSRATFFVVGNRVNSYKKVLKSTYDNGNEIANHTYSHPTLTSLSTSKVKSQISMTDSRVKAITGEAPSLIRAPGGATNTRVRNAINKPFIFWSIDTLDWKHRNKTKTINTVMKNVKDGDIILMHDIHKPSKEAALELIPKLKKAGYQIVTVSELAAYRGYNLKDHTTYSSFRKK
ncbi:MAG: polysaccharide deacetylase family protein, partial [Dorea sp.]